MYSTNAKRLRYYQVCTYFRNTKRQKFVVTKFARILEIQRQKFVNTKFAQILEIHEDWKSKNNDFLLVYQNKHSEEKSDGADHAGWRDWNGLTKHARVQKPGQREPSNWNKNHSCCCCWYYCSYSCFTWWHLRGLMQHFNAG